MHLALIVAVAENGVIGRDNDLPWRLPEDMAYFKRTTMGKPVIMGRKTWESIGRPLPGRSNIVITRDHEFTAEGAQVVASLSEALDLAQDIARADGAHEAVIIGGAQIYAEALPLADRLYLTEVHAEVEGDVKLPPVDWTAWQERDRQRREAVPPNPFDYSFVVYERRA